MDRHQLGMDLFAVHALLCEKFDDSSVLEYLPACFRKVNDIAVSRQEH